MYVHGNGRYYDTAYHGIINILHQSQAAAGALAPGGGGTSAVPEISPGSLRWTEACTFADALSVKIFKLLLYTNHSLTALMQLHKHFVHCRDFSEFAFINTSFETSPRPSVQVSGLGHLTAAAGGGSYKYWAWASTHYRAFGELIEIASAKTKLVLPYPPPGSTANQAQSLLNVVSNTGFNFMAGEAAASMFSPFSSVNPVFTVQHAGFYYLLAARCAEERWSKFKKATAVEALIPRRSISLHEVRTHNRLSSFDANNAAEISPDLATERTVDHAMIVIELLTKSYEHFKKFKNSRLTLYLASDIARVYEEGGKYDMALKFFERIGKTYRKESWFSVLGSINRIMIKCAQQLGLHQTRLECLVELLCEQLTPDAEELLGILSGSGGDVPSDAIAALAGGVPLPSELSVQLDMDQLAAFVECGVQFRVPQAHVLETVAYQIHIATRSAMSPPTPLPVARILVEFSNSDFDLCLLPIDGESAAAAQRPRVDLVACHDATRHAAVCPPAEGRDKPMWVKRARLDVSAGCSTVYEGSVTASDNQELRIQTVRLVLESGGRRIDLVFKISERPVAALGVKRRWLTRTAADAPLRFVDLPGNGEQSVVRIDQRKPKIDIKFDYVTPVYLDEAVPINLHLHSHESEPMRVFFTFKLGMGVDPGVGGVGGGPSDPLAQFAQNLPDLHSLVESASGATLSRKRSTTHAAAQIAPTQVDLGTLDPDKPFAAQFFIRTFGRPGPRTLQGTIHAYFVSQPLSTTTSATPGSSSPAMQLDLSDTRLLSKHSSDDATDVLVFEQPFEVAAEIAQSANPALEIEALTGLLGPAGNGSGGNGGGGDGDVDVDVLVDPKRIFEWNLSAALKLVGSWDVEVEHATLTTTHLSNPSSVLVAVREVSQPEGGKVWHQNHVHNYAFNITTAVEALSASTKVDIGSLAVRWRRLKPETGDWVRTVVEMPKADVHSEILRIYADIPGEIYVGRPFKLRYVIQNTTLHLAELVTFVESSEHFVFAGYKQRHYRVLPLSTRVLSFHVMPLTSGRCALPVVKTMKRTDAAALAGKDATGSGSQIGIDLAAREKVFAVCCGKMHSHGSKHGELYVHVQPTAGW
ncbi:Foie gras liver health family 1-domain-containing protein [Entophlyctis helioformis]|nr:Foie gras liver health family 1-domain-containing protein [Entophlyctis helioformis]